jgi:rubrerythrin
MAPSRTIDLLERARRYHRELGEFFSRAAHDVQREDVRRLLEYMSRHEEYLDRCLHEYEKGASRAVLETWFKPAPQFARTHCFDSVEIRPDMSTDEAVRMAVRLHDCVTQLFEHLAERAVSHQLYDALCDLLQMERDEEEKLLRAVSME